MLLLRHLQAVGQQCKKEDLPLSRLWHLQTWCWSWQGLHALSGKLQQLRLLRPCSNSLQRCNVCITISHADSHVCIPRATDSGCPICTDYLFTSSAAVVSMPCGHYMHKQCYTLYMETAYKCPICKKSAVKMDLQWRKLTSAIEAQPMPEQFENTRAIIQCNDCSRKSSVKYHWLGNQCDNCDSYNTTSYES
jgi:hypothetical protein